MHTKQVPCGSPGAPVVYTYDDQYDPRAECASIVGEDFPCEEIHSSDRLPISKEACHAKASQALVLCAATSRCVAVVQKANSEVATLRTAPRFHPELLPSHTIRECNSISRRMRCHMLRQGAKRASCSAADLKLWMRLGCGAGTSYAWLHKQKAERACASRSSPPT